MNCNSGIKGDDSDVDIETITDTAWSIEMPGDSIQNISSASALISTKPLLEFRNPYIRDGIPIPITRSYRIKKMPSRKSGKISVSRALSLKSQTENSAARCFVILGQESKLLNEKKFTKVQSQPKYTRVHNSVRFCVSAAMSATTTVRSTQRARRTYIRNPTVHAIDKQGSYQHYLLKKIKHLKSAMFTYAQNIHREIGLFCFALDSFSSYFDHEITLLKSKVGSHDYNNQLQLLISKVRSRQHNLRMRRYSIDSVLNSYACDLEKKIMLLNSKITSYANDLGMQITLINSTINSFDVDVSRKYETWKSETKQYLHKVARGIRAAISEKNVKKS